MPNRNISPLLKFLRTLAACVVLAATGFAQKSTSDQVLGLRGNIAIYATVNGNNTVIEFRGEKTLVLVGQRDAASLTPSPWAGTGRLLLAHGVIGIVGDDGMRTLLKFPRAATPKSLDRLFDTVQTYQIYGIATYGEKVPLTEQQLSSIRQFGESGGGGPKNAESCSDCKSGGEGATSCSEGSCSVTCSGGFYACCKDSGCHCCRDIP